jgi:uncharacterized protein involved in exopolysaccharide biosynthesis
MNTETVGLTYRELGQLLRTSWIAIVASALSGGLVGLVIALVTVPVYRAQALLAPASADTGGASTLARLASQFAPLAGSIGDIAGKSGLESEQVRVATLRSRRLTEEFITERNLLPVLLPECWDAARRAWRSKNGKSCEPTMGDAIEMFDDEVRSVSEDRRTGLVTVRIEWRDNAAAADWANDLVARTNEFLRTRAIDDAQRSIGFLEKELEKTTVVERRQIIYRLIESRLSEIMMANANSEYAFLVVDPAAVPDADRFVRPRRALMVLVGVVLGMLAGIAYASLRWIRKGG